MKVYTSASEAQEAYKSVLSKIETLDGEFKRAEPTEEQLKQYDGLLEEGRDIGKQLDRFKAAAELKAWGEQSQGSKVAATFDRQVLPGEGDMPGVTVDPNSGEMYAIAGAYKGIGEKKLAALKAGEYKDAFADYIRSAGLGRAVKGDAMKVLNEGSDPSGGFWIPPDFRPELVKKMAVMATVRPNARVYTTGTDHITFPAVNYNGGSDDTYANLFTSGVRFSWRGSQASTTDISESTNPIAGQINIPVHLATAAIIMTREQLEDNSFDILGYISELGAEAYALGEESAYTNGTGAGQPRGFAVHPSMNIAYSTFSTVAGVTYWGNQILSGTTTIAWGGTTTGVIGVEAQLPPQYEASARWYGNKTTFAALRSINAGTSTLPQWSLGDSYPNYANGMSPSLLGYGITKNQFISNPATGNEYLFLGDLKGYYIVDRVGLSVEVFREVYGLRDQVVVYMRKRTGGDLVHYWRMKVLSST